MQTEAADPDPGRPVTVAPGIVRVLAPNPSPMTFHGTNTYLVGRERLTVIDPGPDLPAHLAALRAAIGGRPVTRVLVTHAHLDHSPLAARLAAETGAPVLAFGGALAGRSAVMRDLAGRGLAGGGEGVDRAFRADRKLTDGARLPLEQGEILAVHTPGHMGNHMCFLTDGICFTGDHVMGWSSSLVSPPDGDVTDFVASCRRLRALAPERLLPGHGPPVTRPAERIDALLAHRAAREAQILDALAAGPAAPAALTLRVYADTPPALRPAAERNLFAHLVDLHVRGRVAARPRLALQAEFRLTG